MGSIINSVGEIQLSLIGTIFVYAKKGHDILISSKPRRILKEGKLVLLQIVLVNNFKCQKSHPSRMTFYWLASLHLPNGKGRTCSPKISLFL